MTFRREIIVANNSLSNSIYCVFTQSWLRKQNLIKFSIHLQNGSPLWTRWWTSGFIKFGDFFTRWGIITWKVELCSGEWVNQLIFNISFTWKAKRFLTRAKRKLLHSESLVTCFMRWDCRTTVDSSVRVPEAVDVGLRLTRTYVVLSSGKHTNCKIFKKIFNPEGEQRVGDWGYIWNETIC